MAMSYVRCGVKSGGDDFVVYLQGGAEGVGFREMACYALNHIYFSFYSSSCVVKDFKGNWQKWSSRCFGYGQGYEIKKWQWDILSFIVLDNIGLYGLERPIRWVQGAYGCILGFKREAGKIRQLTIQGAYGCILVGCYTRVRQDTDEIYTRLDDEQFERQLMAGRLNMLYRDRHAHARTARLMETEARMSREAWGRSMDASDLTRAEVMSLRTQVEAEAVHRGTEAAEEASDSDDRVAMSIRVRRGSGEDVSRGLGTIMDASDLTRAEVMSLRTQVVAQHAVITEPQAADRRRQAVITEMLAADRRRQKQFIEALKLLKRLQTQMTEFERQQGPAKGPAQPDAPEEAGSSSKYVMG
ncbi:hypothetical protein Tco_0379026 [Tanacetum coccineum]